MPLNNTGIKYHYHTRIEKFKLKNFVVCCLLKICKVIRKNIPEFAYILNYVFIRENASTIMIRYFDNRI